MIIIHILAGGPDNYVPELHKWKACDKWIGVDRGVFTLIEQGIIPDEAFGDFDSINAEQLKVIQDRLEDLHIYPSEKDATDLDLAVEWAISKKPAYVRIFGATGGRIDHMFGAVQLLYKSLQENVKVELVDKQNSIQLFSPGTHEIEERIHAKYVSFIPYAGGVENLTLTGFKYPLTNHYVELGSTLCISNELLTQRGTFSFTTGILMMIRSNDADCL
ncbi:thiamine diphosphokinase [Priestia flexa]|uniref:thiamine diphosphokinase n=1 Tax=Priestia flexa TaxID=86664 RepID=UPI001B322BE8